MTTSSVEVKGLTKVFYDESRGEIRAVDGIDFDCRSGEIFGLLGANGGLQDLDLVEVIRNRTIEHQLAIAVREHVSERVSGALVEAGHEWVITTLLSSPHHR